VSAAIADAVAFQRASRPSILASSAARRRRNA
jgi:hypothetical protein